MRKMPVFFPVAVNYWLVRFILFTAASLLLLLTGCRPTVKKEFSIGFSQCTLANKWRQTMLAGMQREISFHPEVSFVYRDANGDSQLQIEQIQELIDLGVDLLIVSPNEAKPITGIVEKAFNKGIKVIVVDRKTLSDHYTAYVGASNYEVGATAATFSSNLLKGRGTVLEVSDLPGSSADVARHQGFLETVNTHPDLAFAGKVYERGDEFPSNENVTKFLQSHPGINMIFAQNDRLALSAYRASKQLGLEKQVGIIGVDGLVGNDGGMDLVERGVLKGTVLYPTGGEEAILTAMKVLKGEPYKKDNLATITIIDSSNVRIMKLQAEKMLAQQESIDKSQRTIEEQAAITRSQTTAIYSISVLLALAIILGGVAFFYLKENRKINSQLEAQNLEILNQQSRLIEMTDRANEATEAKFNFFTSISHEFRTPLTLILAPLEELMANNRYPAARSGLTMIQRNVIRLLRLVNQLIDFRRVEAHKMELKASQNDLVAFTREIVEAFGNAAKKKGIDLRFFTSENELNVWFDTSMLDKVLNNLLSNALKFTRETGFIHVSVSKAAGSKTAQVEVTDNGVGMNPNEVSHAFDLFYQGGYETNRGSGIGLALCKELVSLHHGSIEVSSQQGKGTSFIIELPIGANHLEEGQQVTAGDKNYTVDQEQTAMYITDLLPLEEQPIELLEPGETHCHTVLIVEDNPDLLKFLGTRLGRHYDVILSANGQHALGMALEEMPDIIVSDVMMPGKDGMELARMLKTDIRTSHIPIILLTAKAAAGQQAEGFTRLVDAYITKPFNADVLEKNIKSLLENREKMKAHFTANNQLDAKLQGLKKNDRRFATDFSAFVEANIANEAFRVEDICQHFGISRVQLYRKVKAVLQINVNEYILATRLQKARYYLQHEDLPISEVSYKVGFSSPSYFSTVFKSKFNISPKDFKESKVGV